MTMTRLGALIAILASALLTGCGAAILDASAAHTSLEITRTPGLLILPVIDQTIDDPSTVSRLEADINQLPPFPPGAISCPIDFGTSYKLVFTVNGVRSETAVVSAEGCRGVLLGNGRALWALNAPSLYADLGTALGLTPDQLQPLPCPAPDATVCYRQP